MKKEFPIPPDDLRKTKKNSKKDSKTNFERFDTADYDTFKNSSSINMLRSKHVEDMRLNILSYSVLSDKKHYLPSEIKVNIPKINILLFGPSGSGKSSFIRTLFRSLYCSPYLPPDATEKLIIRDSFENEGTLKFTKFWLKEETEDTSGITICDTRGHIYMNNMEKEQFKVIVDVLE